MAAIRINDNVLQEALKARWEDVNPNKLVKWNEAYPYYFEELENNLIYEMLSIVRESYEKGSGNEFKNRAYKGKELPPKMHALKSSSAMTFNIFGNGDEKKSKYIYINIINNKHNLPQGKYKLTYEEKLRALGSPANLDVCLSSESENAILFFEMKMTEWLVGGPSPLRVAYNPKNHGDSYPEEIAVLFDKYIEKEKDSDDYKIYHSEKNGDNFKCTKQYFDVFQIIKHMLGIYNHKDEPLKKIILVIGYWTLPDGLLKDVAQKNNYEYIKTEFEKEVDEFISCVEYKNAVELFKPESFEVKRMTVSQIVDCIGKSSIKGLKRYIDIKE